MSNKSLLLFLATLVVLTGCRFAVELTKAPPPLPPPVSSPEPKILVICDQYKAPVLPDMPAAPRLSDEDAEDPAKVAEALLDYMEQVRAVVVIRDGLRLKAIQEHKDSCRPIISPSPTVDKTVQ